MSMYSQVPAAYPQGIYPPASGYQQPAVSGYSYPQLHPSQPSAPTPVYHVDPLSFRRDFTARIAELTINSRPIIQSLSMYAQEYARWADVVAQCIQTHIRRVSFPVHSHDIFTFYSRWMDKRLQWHSLFCSRFNVIRHIV